MKTKLHELTDRWAAMLLVLVIIFLLFAGPLSQKADAVVVSSVIVGAVIATMALAGITFVASGMTAAQLQDWVSEKLNEWASDLGSPLDHLINSAGIGVTISGLLTVGTAAAQGISDFIAWLRSDLSLQNNDTQVITNPGFFVGNQKVWVTPIDYNTGVIFYNQNYFWWRVTQGSDVQGYCYIYKNTENDKLYPVIISSSTTATYGMSYTAYYNFGGAAASTPLNNGYYYSLIDVGYTGLAYPDELISTVHPSALSGSQFKDQGGLAIGTGVITIPQVQNDDKVFVDVGALPGSTVTEVTDGVISDAITGTLDVSGEVAESEPEYVIDGPEPVYGLADVFPFCIPFDLYDFVSCLAADPVAPHFEWRLYVEDLVDYTFVIDLQQFETVAQIFRTMFLLAFIIGLAMVTRHLMRS